MSKKHKKSDDRQFGIFDYLKSISSLPEHEEGQYKIIDRLRASLRAAIKSSDLSIHQIAGEMSHLLGETITRERIYSWTRQSDEINGRPGRHIPAEQLPAFCHVTCCNDPLIIMGQMVGVHILPGPDALRAEIQKLDENLKKTKAEKRKRQMFLKEMEGTKRG
jgi:hypothetical protein